MPHTLSCKLRSVAQTHLHGVILSSKHAKLLLLVLYAPQTCCKMQVAYYIHGNAGAHSTKPWQKPVQKEVLQLQMLLCIPSARIGAGSTCPAPVKLLGTLHAVYLQMAQLEDAVLNSL